jgi:hypothetical protein
VVLGSFLVATLIAVLVFVFIYIYTYQFSIFTNLKLVALPTELEKTAASVVVRFVMLPILILLSLDIIAKSKLRAGFIVFVVTGALLILIQQCFRWTGIIQYTPAGNVWSSLAWFPMLGIVAGCMTAFRRMMGKELNLT